MLKLVRITGGVIFIAVLLYVANQVVRDCPTGPYLYDNCLWLWLRGQLGLAQSKLGRAVALECVGLGLLASLYLTARYVFPPMRGGRRCQSIPAPDLPPYAHATKEDPGGPAPQPGP